MPPVRIDLPIFHSPTGAFGHFGGEVVLERLPQAEQPFPWPENWLSKHRELFKSQEMQVWSITPWELQPGIQHISMFGIVCDGKAEAAALAKHIAQVSGIWFVEY